LTEFLASFELLWIWTSREVRVRYSQSLLGVAWAVLQPLALMLVFTLVFSNLVRIPSDGVPYPVFAYSALLSWTFFSSAVSFAIPSLTTQMGLVTKTYFPREILPIAAVLACLVDFGFAGLLLVGLLLLNGITPNPAWLALPLVLFVQLVFTIGLVLLGAAVNVFYRDVRFVLPLILQVWLYASPVIYPSSMVPPTWLSLYRLNPLVGVIEGFRDILLHGQPPEWAALGNAALVGFLTCGIGYAVFKLLEMQFADVI
jgi:lipopolysaccharide transport system permease protein